MTICERFDVIVVPFPFVDLAVAKPRPALVLSLHDFNSAGQTVLAMITRAIGGRWPTDHSIADLTRAGLRTASVVRFKLFTLDNRLLSRRIGKLADHDARTSLVGLQAS